MENEDNKPIAKNVNDNRPSVWKRFMTLYTFLLPLVVCIVFFYQVLFSKWVDLLLKDFFMVFPLSVYLLSLGVSLVLIPVILIGIKIHDNVQQEKERNIRFSKSQGKHRESEFGLFCKGFQDSFFGEIIQILLYFVLLGILIILFFAVFFLLPNFLQNCAQAILPHSEPAVSVHDSSGQSGWGGFFIAMMLFALNQLLLFGFFVVFFYVLIRRLGAYQIRRLRVYRRQKARRKERLTKIRNEQQAPPPDSPEQQESFDDDKTENDF